MAIQLYNTLSRKKEAFAPIDPENVRMYVCGPTVYDYAHIGNARPVVVFDTLYRLLRHVYGNDHVTYVRNITDVDDKIIAAHKETGEPIEAITSRFAAAYEDDMAALNALRPDVSPRATAHIPQMIAMMQKLIDKGNAYAADGHVLFHVPSMEGYGALSRHSRDALIAGARVEVAPYKKDPADFVLWKPSTPDQPGWDSPWGRGRPGWHLECSAMSETHLGDSFDIHGGGQDLIFPHHENEIAQSVCAHGGKPFANYWMHNGYLTVDGEKMSKSLGNFYTVHDLLEEGIPGEAIRLALLSAHYRQPLDFSKQALAEAKGQLDRLYGALRGVPANGAAARPGEALMVALSDDLNTPRALAELHDAAGTLNRATDDGERATARARLLAGASLLGLLQQDPEDWFKGAGVSVKGPGAEEIEDLIRRRAEARKSKDFAEADRIRDTLAEAGVVLEDAAGATTWKRSR